MTHSSTKLLFVTISEITLVSQASETELSTALLPLSVFGSVRFPLFDNKSTYSGRRITLSFSTEEGWEDRKGKGEQDSKESA
jgi:hypothetical protein